MMVKVIPQTMHFTGGVTEESLVGFRKFLETSPAPKTAKVECYAKYNICYQGTWSEESVTVLYLDGKAFLTDGFLWGYGGEGPKGLATMITETLCKMYPELDHSTVANRAFQFVMSKSMTSSWKKDLTLISF
jgi:hypothetical protein